MRKAGMFKKGDVVVLSVGPGTEFRPGPKDFWGCCVVGDVVDGTASLKGTTWKFDATTGASLDDNTEIRLIRPDDRPTYEREMLLRRVRMGLDEWASGRHETIDHCSNAELESYAEILESVMPGLSASSRWPWAEEVKAAFGD